jgi:hypothetical protein
MAWNHLAHVLPGRDIRWLLDRKLPFPSCANLPDRWKGLLKSWRHYYTGIPVQELAPGELLSLPAHWFLQRRDASLLTPSGAWKRAGIFSVEDLVDTLSAPRWSIAPNKSPLHARIERSLMEGRIGWTSLIDRLPEQHPGEVVSPWSLATLAGAKAMFFSSRIGRKWEIERCSPQEPTLSKTLTAQKHWSLVFSRHLLPKYQSLLWQLQSNAFWTVSRIALINPQASPLCP